jgi:hypothetical protein
MAVVDPNPPKHQLLATSLLLLEPGLFSTPKSLC